MIRLMKLELKRNKLSKYVLASKVVFIVLLGLTYFIAIVSKVEKESVFQNYENIFKFTGILFLSISLFK